jgi:hypothetical protein
MQKKTSKLINKKTKLLKIIFNLRKNKNNREIFLLKPTPSQMGC